MIKADLYYLKFWSKNLLSFCSTYTLPQNYSTINQFSSMKFLVSRMQNHHGGDFNVHQDAVVDNSGGKSEIKPTDKDIKDNARE